VIIKHPLSKLLSFVLNLVNFCLDKSYHHSFGLLFITMFLLKCVADAANVEEKLTKATIAYISDTDTNKKDLKEVADIVIQQQRDKRGLLSIHKVYDAILFLGGTLK
jgi:hypothetical protein